MIMLSLFLSLSLDLDSIETKIKEYSIISSILIVCKSMLQALKAHYIVNQNLYQHQF